MLEDLDPSAADHSHRSAGGPVPLQGPAAGAPVTGQALTAERKTEEFVAGKGVVTRWERIRRQNHWFDALYNAAVAGHAAGVRLIRENKVYVPPIKPYGVVSRGFTNRRF